MNVQSNINYGSSLTVDPMNNTKSSFNKTNLNSSNKSGVGETVVFYESEYFSSTMPTSLPSDIKRGDIAKPTTVFMNEINRPQTPTLKIN